MASLDGLAVGTSSGISGPFPKVIIFETNRMGKLTLRL
jgi:hypothetical protein